MVRDGGAAALLEDPALLAALVEHQPPTVVEAVDGSPILFNSAFLRLFGVNDPKDVPHETAGDLNRMAELRAARRPAADRLALPDGRVLQRDYVPVTEGERLVAHMWRYADITGQVRGEEAWRAATERLRELATNAETAREEERRKLARLLHDELGQRFTTIRLELMAAISQFQRTALPEQIAVVDRLQAAAGQIDVSIAIVRRLSSDLRPPLLDHLGIVAAARFEASAFERRTGVRCRVSAFPADFALDAQRSTVVYRILLEALTNVARHAHAGAVRVAFLRRRGVVLVKIEDNGRGISQDEAANPHALGLLGMRERALPLGGDVRVVCAPRGGTRVLAIFPV